MTLFYYVVLALAVGTGTYAAVTGHWGTFVGALLVALFFIICPEAIDGQD